MGAELRLSEAAARVALEPERHVAVILRAAERVVVSWKNGGGLTRELAVYPPGSNLEDFAWRVSLAEVHAGGPFSSFPGVDRQMAVLAGELALSIDEGDSLTLSRHSPPLGFSGEARVVAQPLGGVVTDLNVMTRRDRYTHRLTRLSPALDRKSTRLNSSHRIASRMPSSA